MDLRARRIISSREISKKHSFTYCRVKDFKYLKLGVSWSQRLNVNYVCFHFTITLSEKISMLFIYIMFDFVNTLLYQFSILQIFNFERPLERGKIRLNSTYLPWILLFESMLLYWADSLSRSSIRKCFFQWNMREDKKKY